MLKTEANQPFSKLADRAIRRNDRGVPLSIPEGVSAMLRGWQMINHLYQAELDDYEKSNFSPGNLPKKKEDVALRNAFQTRFLCRSTSYVITVCTLDGILKESYSKLLRLLTQRAPNCIPGLNEVSNTRKMEIETHRFYRDKVFAHTSFANPNHNKHGKKGVDSESLQRSSLIYFSGEILGTDQVGERVCFALGGGGVCLDDKLPDTKTLSILGDRHKILGHYQAWEEMFLTVLNKIPMENVPSASDGNSGT